MKTGSTYSKDFGYYLSLPKVDLHRHLEGSLRLRTLLEVSRSLGLGLPVTTSRLRELVQVGDDEHFTFENFLSKFKTLRQFYRSPEIIARVTREAIADAAADGVRYLELRFTPSALCQAAGFQMEEVVDWVIESTREAESSLGIMVRLIISANRHEGPLLAEQMAQIAVDRIDKGIVGFDLAGNEAHYSALPFAGIFRDAHQAGLRLTAHAGEWGGAQNVREVIEHLGVERIGHGVRVLEDPDVVQLARETGVTFEVCITSNYQSGAIPIHSVHPLKRMMSMGLNTTINTDDPSISQIALSDEYQRACEDLGLSLAGLRERVLAAAQAAFLTKQERQRLVASLAKEFPLG
ncbi:MAG: adenosine deaminase [Chloroflexi bacterium]|nr:adenosine deaminase [Chloroflexota bacterium]